MSLNPTYVDNADAVRRFSGKKCSPAKAAANRKAALILTIVCLLLLASMFGLIFPDPIHAY